MSEPAEAGRAFDRLLGRWEARDVAPVVSLAVLVVFFLVAVPDFRKPSTISSVLTQGSVLAIVSVGLTYVLLCAEIDLSVGMMALWAACVCGWLFEHWVGGLSGEPEASWWLIAAVVTFPLAASLGLGLVCGALTVWSRLPSFIISLAMMFIAEGWAKHITQGQQFKIPGFLRILGNDGFYPDRVVEAVIRVRVPFLHVLFHVWIPYSAVLAGLLLALGYLVLQHTRFGRYVYMTGGNREAARLAGVRTGLIVLACLAICAVTAGIGGLVNSGRMTNVTIDQNKDLLLSAVACVVLGGTSLFGGEGGMGKTLIGVLTFTVLSVGLMKVEWVPDLARQLLTGVVLMVALVINGVLAKRS